MRRSSPRAREAEGSRELLKPARYRVCPGKPGPSPSMRTNCFERSRQHTQDRKNTKGQRQSGNRETCRKGKIEAGKAQLIDEIGQHIDLTAADQLRGRERAERPSESGRQAGD